MVERKAVGKSVVVAGGWRRSAAGVSLGSLDGRLEGRLEAGLVGLGGAGRAAGAAFHRGCCARAGILVLSFLRFSSGSA